MQNDIDEMFKLLDIDTRKEYWVNPIELINLYPDIPRGRVYNFIQKYKDTLFVKKIKKNKPLLNLALLKEYHEKRNRVLSEYWDYYFEGSRILGSDNKLAEYLEKQTGITQSAWNNFFASRMTYSGNDNILYLKFSKKFVLLIHEVKKLVERGK